MFGDLSELIKKKLKEDGHYAVLPGSSSLHTSPMASVDTDEDSDSSTRSPVKKMGFLSKLFRSKAKNSDDEASTSSTYDSKRYEHTDSQSSLDSDGPKYEAKGVINRKKKRTLALYDKKAGSQKKHPGWAKIRPAPDSPNKSKETKFYNSGDQDTASSNDSLTEEVFKPVLTLVEDKQILEEFDPLWTAEADKNEPSEDVSLEEMMKVPVKPPRNKINTEKMPSADNEVRIKIPEIKIATLEAIQENEVPEEEEPLDKAELKEENPEPELAQAKVSYEGLDSELTKPVVHDNSADVKEGEIQVVAQEANALPAVPDDLATASYAELQPVFVQPRRRPKIEDLFGDNKEEPKEEDNPPEPVVEQLIEPLEDIAPEEEDLLKFPPTPEEDLKLAVYQPTEEEEEANRQIIADFFAERDRVLEEEDIVNYSNNIEISKIEIYEEDIKRYHKSLKYHRGPVDHDIIFTTVETALNFIEKLVKQRDRKKKVGFLPELIEKCLKSKAKREEEARKKKEKEEKKKKGPNKPKMWLVFNRLGKEKVIICTPADFYDSD